MIRAILSTSFNLLFGVVLLAFLPAIFHQFTGFAADFFQHFPWHPIAIGTVLGFAIERLLNRHLPEVAILEHELTHALAGIPFGFIPTGISVSRYCGGECRQIALLVGPLVFLYPIARRIVTLAPYFLPTFTAIMAGFRPLVHAGWQPWYDLGIGITFGYHTLSTLAELRENFTNRTFIGVGSGRLTKSDIGKSGMIFSPIFIVVATLVVHGLVLAVIVHGYTGAATWWEETWRSTYSFAIPHIVKLANACR